MAMTVPRVVEVALRNARAAGVRKPWWVANGVPETPDELIDIADHFRARFGCDSELVKLLLRTAERWRQQVVDADADGYDRGFEDGKERIER